VVCISRGSESKERQKSCSCDERLEYREGEGALTETGIYGEGRAVWTGYAQGAAERRGLRTRVRGVCVSGARYIGSGGDDNEGEGVARS